MRLGSGRDRLGFGWLRHGYGCYFDAVGSANRMGRPAAFDH